MLTKLLPEYIKQPIRTYIQEYIDSHIRTYIQEYIDSHMQKYHFFSSHPGEREYCIVAKGPTLEQSEGRALPIPPAELWVGYAEDAESYIAGGKQHVTDMIKAIENGGFSITEARRVMEFGCAAGRMIRHLPELAPHAELWGVDISAQHIRWCIDNLTPTINFVTTTTLPHLPFEDRLFDLVFCGSVFTHIEDIAETWLQELGRVLRPSGRLYITIHDEHTVRLLDSKHSNHWLAKQMLKNPVYSNNRDEFNLIVLGRGTASQVFYHSNYFRRILPPCFRWVSYTPEAYEYQSAVVLEKLAT